MQKPDPQTTGDYWREHCRHMAWAWTLFAVFTPACAAAFGCWLGVSRDDGWIGWPLLMSFSALVAIGAFFVARGFWTESHD